MKQIHRFQTAFSPSYGFHVGNTLPLISLAGDSPSWAAPCAQSFCRPSPFKFLLQWHDVQTTRGCGGGEVLYMHSKFHLLISFWSRRKNRSSKLEEIFFDRHYRWSEWNVAKIPLFCQLPNSKSSYYTTAHFIWWPVEGKAWDLWM